METGEHFWGGDWGNILKKKERRRVKLHRSLFFRVARFQSTLNLTGVYIIYMTPGELTNERYIGGWGGGRGTTSAELTIINTQFLLMGPVCFIVRARLMTVIVTATATTVSLAGVVCARQGKNS